MTTSDLLGQVKRTGTLPGLPDGLYLDGSFQAARAGRRMESFDPGTGEAFAEFARGDAADVEAAVASAAHAFKSVWRDTAPGGGGGGRGGGGPGRAPPRPSRAWGAPPPRPRAAASWRAPRR